MNHIALVGNPNCGKSTLFNRLTGLRQKISNLPGTTVEQKKGIWSIHGHQLKVTDLPGIYSLFSQSEEEKIAVNQLLGLQSNDQPDCVLFLLDATNIRRNLLLLSQISELDIPVCVALTMQDTAKKRGIEVSPEALSNALGVPVKAVNPRTGEGMPELETLISEPRVPQFPNANKDTRQKLEKFLLGEPIKGLSAETLQRYKSIELLISQGLVKKSKLITNRTQKLDRIFTHRIWGFAIFACIMLTIFQGVFTLADYPMTWIELAFGRLQNYAALQLPDSFFSNMLVDGIIPGLGGVLIFLPQIAILFFFISLLEDSGYMVRASFITDKLMRRIGLNGRSVIPLIGGFACAIPSIMAAKSIKNRRERIATMFVIPLMSCSARLPVYVLLISLAIPAGTRFGPIGLQSLVMTLAYFIGIIAAMVIAFFISLRKSDSTLSEFVLELPAYQIPRLQNVSSDVYHKSLSFIKTAGKIIMIISVILWFLSSHGPGTAMTDAKSHVLQETGASETHDLTSRIAAAELEASYAGMMGKWIEPAISPLGYDWKTGIALITSFAAREVFVGTMNTMFNAEGDGDVSGIRQKMRESKDKITGKPLYGAGYAFSLIIFYAFALQCMSTMAVMKKETGSWKLPILQFVLFGAIAWICAFIAYQTSLLI